MKPYIILATSAALGLASACQSAPMPPASSAEVIVDAQSGEGWFYPPVKATEVRPVRFGMMSGAGPAQRQYFTDRVNMETSGRGLTAPLVVQSVGEEHDVLVLMVSGFHEPLTPYISRGLLARMTSVVRFTPTITEMGLSQELDVYDVASVLGFKQIVVTDGRSAAFATDLVAESS